MYQREHKNICLQWHPLLIPTHSLPLATGSSFVLWPDSQLLGKKIKIEYWVWVEEKTVKWNWNIDFTHPVQLTHELVSKTRSGFVSESKNGRNRAMKVSQRLFLSSGWRQLLSFHGSEDSARLATWQRRQQLTFWSWADSAQLKCQLGSVEMPPASDKALVENNWSNRHCCCLDTTDKEASWLQKKALH